MKGKWKHFYVDLEPNTVLNYEPGKYVIVQIQ